MNLKRKVDMQERRIIALQKQVETLKQENSVLRSEKQNLLDRERQYNEKMEIFENLQLTYENNIIEILEIKEQYQQAMYDARKIKKEISKQFYPLIKRLRSQS